MTQAPSLSSPSDRPWMAAEQPTAKRIDRLLTVMTLTEKIGQLRQANNRKLDKSTEAAVREGHIGSFLNLSADEIRHYQHLAVEESRLGIPLVLGFDVIHGLRTIFPIPLGQAASFDPATIRAGARVAAQEAASEGIHWTFAPMVDIARDPRWGRVAESLGEDTVLASRLGAAMVEGFQTANTRQPEAIAACAKHFVGYGAAEGGRDYNTTLIPESELRNVYLPPFEACVRAGTLSLMSAFNDLNGVPTSGNPWTLRDILREEWNFPGTVVSDWESVWEMIPHGFARDRKEAALKGVTAGVDMEMVSTCYADHLEGLVRSGAVEESLIDEAVRHVLHLKFELGLFENPHPQEQVAPCALSSSHRDTAREAAVKSCVLLKNDGILPLDADALRHVAVIGPLADNGTDQLGCWAGRGDGADCVTPLTALREALSDGATLSYAPGLASPRDSSEAGFAEAVAAAREADVALLFLGEDALLSGEAHSRTRLDLPGAQEALLARVAATGTPVVVVLMTGRPLVLGAVAPQANALLCAWHPGTMGGPALADLLLGAAAPSGRLPVSFPASVGQVPVYYNHRNTGRPPKPDAPAPELGTPENPLGFSSTYLDAPPNAAYPFGYGLTYTSFAYSEPVLESDRLARTEALRASVRLTNTGPREGTELVQLYVRDRYASLTRPVRELKDFQHVTLGPGESREVVFELPVDALAFFDVHGERQLEAGAFDLWISPHATAGNSVTFELV